MDHVPPWEMSWSRSGVAELPFLHYSLEVKPQCDRSFEGVYSANDLLSGLKVSAFIFGNWRFNDKSQEATGLTRVLSLIFANITNLQRPRSPWAFDKIHPRIVTLFKFAEGCLSDLLYLPHPIHFRFMAHHLCPIC